MPYYLLTPRTDEVLIKKKTEERNLLKFVFLNDSDKCPLTSFVQVYWDFRIKFCFVKKRFGFYFDQSERRNEFLTFHLSDWSK